MKKILLPILILLVNQACSSNSTIFVLNPSQSMIMTGKGPGQDGAINPYLNQRSTAVVENIGDNGFSVRIQNKAGKIIEELEVLPKTTKKFLLEKGYELYLDTDKIAKARVGFEKAQPEFM